MKDTNIHQAANIAVFTPTPRKYDRLHKRQGNLMLKLKHLAALLLLAATFAPVTASAQTTATANLAGTVTEASLFAATASTVSVTLTNTEYEAAGTLMQSHFSVTDTVAGTVSVSSFTRDSDTVATLTLAYSGEDITAASTLSVTLAAEGHTGTDDLMTSTIAITASAGSNVCGRTRQVRDRIVAQSSATECTNVDLAAVMTLDLNGRLIAALQGGDFTGLTALQDLDLSRNRLDALPANVFAGLTALQDLDLSSNRLDALPASVFAGLTALQDLDLSINSLGALPANVFAGLTALQILDLNTNRLTALPANVFDELMVLTELRLNGNGLTALPPNIFSRLTALLSLNLSVNQLATLDAGIFNGLSEIVTLRLDRNLLNALPANIFNGLSQLGILTLNGNRLAELPNDVFAGLSGLFSLFLADNNLAELDANIFDGLSSLTNLSLHDNLFTADTGLPAGVFDDVLGMLGPILVPPEPSSGSAFSIDNTVRLAHFVCSRADAMRIVDATIGVDNCLRVSSEQLNAYRQADASLSSLTISEGILVPPFDPSTTAYAVTLANSVASVMVTPTAAQSSATITVNSAAVTSGNTSEMITLTPGVAEEINIVVTAVDDTTETYTVMATSLGTMAPTAELVATPPLTEAALFADTASTVTVTLTGTEYVDMLTPAHFITSDTVTGGSVTVSEVVRTDGMVATLTLGFSGRDLSAAGNLLVAVAAAGHTGSDDVPAGSVPISASTGINICRRTAAVIGVIRATITPAPDCTSVTEADLQSITSLDLSSRMIDSLQSGDFAGLPMLASLNLSDNSLTALPKDIFADLTALRELRLSNNQLTTLDAEIFAGLTALEELFLVNSGLTTLPFGLSEGLSALRTLWLSGNAFTTLPPSIFEPLNMLANLNLQDNSMLTAGTGLSIGIFNRVLDTLGTISTATSGDGFLIDDTVLAAHFVCSRDDADAIVAATSGVSNCLRISSGQLFAYQQADVSLSGLTISAGDLMPPFDPAIADYNVVVAHNIASVTVTPTANSAIRGATITVNGVAVDSGSDSVAIDLMAGAVVPIAIEVRSASSVTRAYTVRVTRAAAPVAMLAVPAPLTEADLNGATVTVTLTDSTYVNTLSADDFTLTTVGGVTVFSVATNSANTVATLTLAYDDTDITTDGTLSVTLRAAGHVGDGDLTTGTVPITANTAPAFDLGESIDAQSYTMDVGISDITLPTATGGNGALSYGITPALPNGLTLSGNTLSGTPTAMQAAITYTYTVRDSDTDMTDTDTDTIDFTITIDANTITGVAAGAVTEDNSTNTATGTLTLAGSDFVAQAGATDRAGGLGTYGNFVLNATSGVWIYTLDNTPGDPQGDATNALAAGAMVTDVFTAVSTPTTTVRRDVIITVTGANDAPTANAGPDQPAVISGATVTLDGSGSSDPDTGDTIDTYTWTHTTSVTLGTTIPAMPTFTAPDVSTPTTLSFTLVVDDGTADSLADTVDIIVNAPSPSATLAGTLTEANLFASTAPTVTVTLTNTEYEAAPGTLMQSHFSVADTVAGTVSVSSFTRDSDTGATLTLAYSGEDITTAGTLSVTLAAAGHTGTDDLMTSTIAITASTGVNVCGRTAEVRDAIVADRSATDCTSITDLAAITTINLSGQSITALASGDFAGLTGLQTLDLDNNSLRALPADIFVGLSSLTSLNLEENLLQSLDANVFAGLSALNTLNVRGNFLTSLDAGLFNGLAALVALNLEGNAFTDGTGLPTGIFDDVLDTLGAIDTTDGFFVDQQVRDAHFVCSRSDFAAIVTETATVSDCLRITSAQLADALAVTITIAADTSPVTEGAAATFTLTADSAPAGDLTVTVTVTDSGNFIAGAAPTTVTITGSETTATLTVMTEDDSADETNGTITATVTAGTGYTVGSPPTASVTVEDNDAAPVTPDPAITIAAVSPSVTEGTAATFTLTADSAPAANLTVTVTVTDSGNFIAGAAPTTVTITGSETTATLTVMTEDDSTDEANGTITATVTAGAGYMAAGGGGNTASVTVEDNDAAPVTPDPAITIAAVSSSVTEGTAATFTLTADSAPAGDLTVTVTVTDSGNFIAGAAPTTVTITGSETTATLTVMTEDDSADETNGTITATVTAGTGYTFGSPLTASVTVEDNDAAPVTPDPAITIAAVSSSVTEGTAATFTLTADSAPAANLTVTVTVTDSGNFIAGAAPTTVTITGSETTATLTVMTEDDSADETNGTITATVTAGAGYMAAGGGGNTASVTVEDNDAAPVTPDPAITIAAVSSSVTEGTAATFTLTADSAPAANLTVTVTVTDSGNFIAGAAPTTVTITGSETTATLTVMTEDDSTDEANGTITATVTAGAGYMAAGGGGNTASVTVQDNDVAPVTPDPAITIAAVSPSVTEGAAATFTLTATPAPASNLTVMVTVTEAGDFIDGTVPTSVTINAAATTAALTVPTTDDSTAEANGTITATVTTGTGYTVDGTDNSASVTVEDNDGDDTGPTPEQTEQLHEEIAPQAVQAIAGNVVASVGARIETAIQGAPPTGGVRLDGQSIEGDGKAVLLGFLDEAPEYTRSIKEGTLNWKRMLANSSFALNAAGGHGIGGAISLWGSGHYTEFNGDDNNLDWDGDSYGFQIGADTRWNNNLLTGVSVSWSEGEVEYIQGSGDSREEGDYTLTLTGLHPYVGWSNDSGSLSLWASAGYADGKVEIEPDEGVERKHDASVVSLAGGFTRSLTDVLSIKGDFSSLEADIDEADEVLNDSDLSIDSQRVRLLLEVRYQQRLPGGGTLARSAEVGYRLDEGDSNADTDGTEVGVSMDYHNPDTRLTLSGKARGLVGDSDYREWGISGLIRLESGTQGLSFTLEPGYGDTAGSAGELWQRQAPSLETERQSYGGRMKMHLGYGLHGGVMPYTEVTSGEALRSFRMGVKWQVGKALDLNLFGEQYEADESDNSLQLEGKLEF